MSNVPAIIEGMMHIVCFMISEPGYYEDGNFGIRIESLVLVTKADTKFNFKDKGFLTFESITLVPIQTKLIDPMLLTESEVCHSQVVVKKFKASVKLFIKYQKCSVQIIEIHVA